jgi:hypothetical protein
MRFTCESDQLLSQLMEMQRDDTAVFRKQAANLIARLRAVSDEPASDPVQHLHVLLLDRLMRNKTHLRSVCGLTDRRRILHVVLLPSNIRLHELRRDESYFMTERSNQSSPVVSTFRRLHRHYASRTLPKNSVTCSRLSLFLRTAFPLASAPCT